MIVGVVSDTHGHVANTLQAIRVLEKFHIEAVIHCGDIGSMEIVELFSAWTTHFVLGNVDRDELGNMIKQEGYICHGRFGELQLAGKKIAVLHSDDEHRFRETIRSQQWDLVCYGHTHVADQQQEGNTLVLNPGALYRATPRSIVVVELPTMDVTSIRL